MVRRHRRLKLDEILAGVGLVIWIIVDVINEHLFGGSNPDVLKIWMVRGVLLVALIVGYAIARNMMAGRAPKRL